MTNRLKENILSLFTLKGAEYIVSFITLPYLLRVLGPASYGKILFFESIVAYGVLFTDYGFNLTGPRDVAKADEKDLSREFSAIFASKLLLLLVALIVGAPLTLLLGERLDTTLLIAASPALFGAVLFPIWYFQGIQQMRFITIFNLIARTISVILIFALVNTEEDTALATLLLASPPLLAGIFSLAMLFIKSPQIFKIPTFKDVIGKIKAGFEIFLSTVSINLYTTTNNFLLGFIAGNAALGLYGAAYKIIQAIKGVMGPISNGIFPHISALSKTSKPDAIAFLKKATKILGVASFLLFILTFIFADLIVSIIMGEGYIKSVELLRIISPLPFLIALSNIFGIQTMVAFQFEKLFSRILMASAAVNFIIGIPLIYQFSSVGLAITTVIVETFVTVTMYVALRKRGIRLI